MDERVQSPLSSHGVDPAEYRGNAYAHNAATTLQAESSIDQASAHLIDRIEVLAQKIDTLVGHPRVQRFLRDSSPEVAEKRGQPITQSGMASFLVEQAERIERCFDRLDDFIDRID